MDGNTMSQEAKPLCAGRDAGIASDQGNASESVANMAAGAMLSGTAEPVATAGGKCTRLPSRAAPVLYLFFGSKGSMFLNIYGR